MSSEVAENDIKKDIKPLIEYSCFFTNCDKIEPLTKLKISDSSFLDDVAAQRGCCPECGKSRKYFCYNCCVPLDSIRDKLPSLKLPISIDIIKHAKETDGKSTAIHAAVLARDKVKVYIYPDVPDYSNENVLLVFPGKNAKPLKDYCDKITNTDSKMEHPKCPFEKVVFIDSTWRQTKRLYGDERLNRLPCVILNDRQSLFWRHQRTKPMSYLATIEAIYYFFVEFDEIFNQERLEPYDGRYDNVLFFFKYMYNKIRKVYDPRIVQLLRERSETIPPED